MSSHCMDGDKDSIGSSIQHLRDSPLGQHLEDYQSMMGLTADKETRIRLKELLENPTSELYCFLMAAPTDTQSEL